MGKYKKGTKMTYYEYNKKKEKEHDKKIGFLIILLVFTAVMLSTSTYAWFTVNRIVYIDSMEVKVEASGGIEISVDGQEWQNTITTDDIRNASITYSYKNAVNQLPIVAHPVSTSLDVDGSTGYLKMFLGNATGVESNRYILTANRDIESSNNEDGNFIAFDMFLKINSSSSNTPLYLSSDSSIEYSGESVSGIENATRIAFVVEGNTSSSSSLGVIQGLTTNSNDNVYIWEPNYDVHSDNGIKNALNMYNINLNNSGNSRVSYDGISSEIKTSDNVYLEKANSSNYPTFFKNVDVDYATTANFNNFQEIFGINNGITKVRVYIWLEGQDVDCEDNSAIGNVKFKFQLTTNPN